MPEANTPPGNRACSWCRQPIRRPRARRYCARGCALRARRERTRRNVAAHRARQERQEPPKRRSLALDFMDVPPDQLPAQQPGWQRDPRRACLGATDLYFAPKASAAAAKEQTDAMCAGCVVLTSCRTFALLEGDAEFGRIAGTGPSRRRLYRRRWAVQPARLPTVDSILVPVVADRRKRERRAKGQ